MTAIGLDRPSGRPGGSTFGISHPTRPESAEASNSNAAESGSGRLDHFLSCSVAQIKTPHEALRNALVMRDEDNAAIK